MTSLDEYMAYYTDLFAEPTSKLLLKICTPIAFFCIIALLWSISFYLFLGVGIAAIAFYYSLAQKTAIAGTLVIGIAWALQLIIGFGGFILLLFLVLALAGQVYAQNLEGERLSFIDNVKLQLLGPLWASGERTLKAFDLY